MASVKKHKIPPEADIDGSHYWFIAQEVALRTGVRPLTPLQWRCMQSIAKGMPFSMVCQSVIGEFDDEQAGSMFVIGVLQFSIQQGWFSDVH